MEPVKGFITDNNIWIKLDFYPTKLVSSPGFFTMVHQKLTKKQDYINSLKTILSQIEVNGEDEAVQEWSRRMTQGDGSSDTYIPSFHLENNVWKWGELKVEVHFCP